MIAAALISLMLRGCAHAWQFMASVMAAVLFVPLMGALFAPPATCRRLVGRCSPVSPA